MGADLVHPKMAYYLLGYPAKKLQFHGVISYTKHKKTLRHAFFLLYVCLFGCELEIQIPLNQM